MAASSVVLADSLWPHLAARINSGYGTAITVPSLYKARLGRTGLDALVAHYSRLIGAPAVLKDDTDTTGVVSIYPSETTWDPVVLEEPPEEETVVTKKSKLPRPPNAFILYRQQHHPIVKEAHPDLHNNQISIILGKQWKSEDAATKALYKRHADDLKKKHMKEHPNYQYQPRKPAEKKRRMTRRKAEAISNRNDLPEGTSTQPASAPTGSPLAIQSSPVFPVFEKTPAGNPVVTFGNEDFDDEIFENLLKEYNESVVAANPQAGTCNQVVYSERTEEAQDDFTYYVDEFDALLESATQLDQEVEAEMRTSGPADNVDGDWYVMNTDQQAHHWDAVYQYDPATELERYNTMLETFH